MKFLVVLVVVWVVYRIWGPHAHRRFPPSAGRTAGGRSTPRRPRAWPGRRTWCPARTAGCTCPARRRYRPTGRAFAAPSMPRQGPCPRRPRMRDAHEERPDPSFLDESSAHEPEVVAQADMQVAADEGTWVQAQLTADELPRLLWQEFAAGRIWLGFMTARLMIAILVLALRI